MKSTGIVRKIDSLGRIVLPKETRKILDIKEKDTIEIFIDNNRIVLEKYHPTCIFCGNSENVIYFNSKRVCPDCIQKLKDNF